MKTVKIQFNEIELKVLLDYIDLVVRTAGLKEAENGLVLAKKLSTAFQEIQNSVEEVKNKKVK